MAISVSSFYGRWNDTEETRMILDARKDFFVADDRSISEDHHLKSQRPADYFEDEAPNDEVNSNVSTSTNGETLDSNNEQYQYIQVEGGVFWGARIFY